MANIYADISKRELPELGAVKALISGDSIDVERKHQNSFKIKNTAKMIYSCNELPEIGESSHAVYRRLLLIQWNSQFIHQKGKNDINVEMLNKLTTARELSGILNLLIKVAQRLKRNGKFTYDTKPSELQKTWSLKSDPIGKFLESCVEKDLETKIPKVKLFDAFTNWCKKNEITPKSEKAFNAKVTEIFEVSPTTGRIEGKPTKIWHGLKILYEVTSDTTVTTLIS